MSIRTYSLLGLVAYAIFLIGTMPAAWLYAHLSREEMKAIRLHGIEGTLWHGGASALHVGPLRLTALRWHTQLWPLLLGRWQSYLTFGQGTPSNGVGSIYWTVNGHMGMEQTTLLFPLEELRPLLVNLPPLTGKAAFHLERISASSTALLQLHGTAHLSEVILSPPLSIALGKFRLEAEKEETDTSLLLRFRDENGPIHLTGTVSLNQDGAYRVTGEAAPRNGAEPRIKELLAYLGTPGTGGKVLLNDTGHMPLTF